MVLKTRGVQMILTLFEIGTISATTSYLAFARIKLLRHKRMAWGQLVAQLRTNSQGPELNCQLFWIQRENLATAGGMRTCLGPSDLRSMYKNARVILEMANYVSECGAEIDPGLLADLRSDALRIRLHLSLALAKCACDHAAASTTENVADVVAIYRGMVEKSFELVQTCGDLLGPDLAYQIR